MAFRIDTPITKTRWELPLKNLPIVEVATDDAADDDNPQQNLGPHSGPQRIVKLTKGGEEMTQEELIGVRFVPLLPGQAREL